MDYVKLEELAQEAARAPGNRIEVDVEDLRTMTADLRKATGFLAAATGSIKTLGDYPYDWIEGANDIIDRYSIHPNMVL